MEYKLCHENWSQFDFLINNFYEIVEYKRGRGVYGDRIILRRPRNPQSVFATPDKQYDFYYLDAHNTKELPRTTAEKIVLITKFVCDPQAMTQIIRTDDANVINWSLNLRKKMRSAKSNDFLAKLHAHRQKQYLLASSEALGLVSPEFANNQIKVL